MDTLLHWSGGIDSTHALYYYLKLNPDKVLLLHHINLITDERRNDKEREAVNNILGWLRSKNLTNFKYIESTFDYGDIEGKVLDGMVVALFTGAITTVYPQIRRMISCTPRDEFQRLGWKVQSRKDRYRVIRETVCQNHPFVVVAPLEQLSKTEIISQLPEDLFALTWYCRTPTQEGKPCGICHTCRQVNV